MFGDNYELGDIEIDELILNSPRFGRKDLTNLLVSASIYESIFTPGIICDIKLSDRIDLLGSVKMVGDETITFNISVKDVEFDSNRMNTKFTLAVHQLAELQSTGAQKSKMYTLKCVSEEAMYAKHCVIQKAYNNVNYEDMINDIVTTYLKSEKPFNYLDPTDTPQILLIPSKKPWEAISMIRKRAVSSDYESSLYFFFENRADGEPSFNFASVEYLLDQDVVKTFHQSDAINFSALEPFHYDDIRKDNNIISYKIPNQFDSLQRIALGGANRVTTINFTSLELETKQDVSTDPINNKMNSSAFASKYFNPDIAPQSVIPIDFVERPFTGIPEATQNLTSIVATMMQNSMKIKVIGDLILTAGAMIECTIPNKKDTTTVSEDPLISGKFLISRIHHRIGEPTEKPRYTCILECIKGPYEEGI